MRLHICAGRIVCSTATIVVDTMRRQSSSQLNLASGSTEDHVKNTSHVESCPAAAADCDVTKCHDGRLNAPSDDVETVRPWAAYWQLFIRVCLSYLLTENKNFARWKIDYSPITIAWWKTVHSPITNRLLTSALILRSSCFIRRIRNCVEHSWQTFKPELTAYAKVTKPSQLGLSKAW